MEWILKHEDTALKPLSKHIAYFPENRENADGTTSSFKPDQFIKVTAGKTKGYLKTELMDRATANFFRVTTSTLKEVPSNTIVIIEKSSALKHYIYLVKNDQSSKIAFWSFIAAIIGAVIKGAFEIGKGSFHPFTFSQTATSNIQAFALFLIIAGLILTFWKGFLDRK